MISTFPCSSEQSFLGSLLPERLRLSAAGGNDRQIAMPSAESGVHVGCAPAQKREAFRQGTRSLSGIEPKKTMGKLSNDLPGAVAFANSPFENQKEGRHDQKNYPHFISYLVRHWHCGYGHPNCQHDFFRYCQIFIFFKLETTDRIQCHYFCFYHLLGNGALHFK